VGLWPPALEVPIHATLQVRPRWLNVLADITVLFSAGCQAHSKWQWCVQWLYKMLQFMAWSSFQECGWRP